MYKVQYEGGIEVEVTAEETIKAMQKHGTDIGVPVAEVPISDYAEMAAREKVQSFIAASPDSMTVEVGECKGIWEVDDE
jgi:hypothetical protein